MSRRHLAVAHATALALATTLLPAPAQSADASADAAAGIVVAVQGMAWTRHAGEARMVRYRDAVFAGDSIATYESALVQIQMNDGALISLRPNSSLLVVSYPTENQLHSANAEHASATAPRVLLRLIKGALRTVTGLTHAIGKRNRDAYRLETPIATIGIRGTDYSVAICAGDCADSPDGMYVGVFDGAVEVANAAGRVVLERGEYAYVADALASPQRRSTRPAALTQAPPANAAEPAVGFDHSDSAAAAEAQTEEQPENVLLPDSAAGAEPASPGSAELVVDVSPNRRSVALARPGQASQSGSGSAGDVLFDAADGLTTLGLVLPDGPQRVSIGSAENKDVGADPASGLQWGRWSGGTATIADVSGTSALDLTQQSLHWISGPEYASTPVLPRSGFAAFDLVGATAPTDQSGQTGTLGHAELVADFDRQVLYSSLDLNLGGDHWRAWGSTALDGTAAFSGTYDHVVVNLLDQGRGDFAGFFVGTDDMPVGAGLSYQLQHADTHISGVAAFALGDHADSSP